MSSVLQWRAERDERIGGVVLALAHSMLDKAIELNIFYSKEHIDLFLLVLTAQHNYAKALAIIDNDQGACSTCLIASIHPHSSVVAFFFHI